MITRLRGTLISRELDHVEVETVGGVVYQVQIPLSIFQRLPKPPAPDFEIRTLQVVREDSLTLYGFIEPFERELFARLLGAPKVGPKVALAMLSTYSAGRARAGNCREGRERPDTGERCREEDSRAARARAVR